MEVMQQKHILYILLIPFHTKYRVKSPPNYLLLSAERRIAEFEIYYFREDSFQLCLHLKCICREIIFFY